MIEREYRTVDKAEWGPGEWQNEPDKIQYVDTDTGLDCLIVRGPSGALCGYVGVPEGHPFFGVGYGACPLGNKCPGFTTEHEWHDYDECKGRIEEDVSVHGGLTFSGFCTEVMAFEEWVAADQRQIAHWVSRGYDPNSTYREYCDWQESVAICHVAEAGRPAKVWWIGFDCAHAGDFSPAFASMYERLGVSSSSWETYRTIGYVRSELNGLAQTLAAMNTVDAVDQLPL